ncbi:hypothetical protein ACFQY5_20445 [Paeniroseomonas aquatica]|uniref:hypothetical protein n=1 Tax=Paeniroseomonas aquatica TaxID=373043 RepID=UPI00360974EE
MASGATPAELAAPLRTLIFEGYALLRGALAPAGFGPTELDLLDSLEAGPPLDPEAEADGRRAACSRGCPPCCSGTRWCGWRGPRWTTTRWPTARCCRAAGPGASASRARRRR